MNYILGSGVVGLLARFILGDKWSIVPFGRSRFYSWEVPLYENFISRDDEIDALLVDFGTKSIGHEYTRAYSFLGDLHFGHQPHLCQSWLNKLFGDTEPPSQSLPYLSTRSKFNIYDIKVNKLYEKLQNIYSQELTNQAKLTSIGNHTLNFGGSSIQFDNIISTIPHHALLGLLGFECDLKHVDVHYAHVVSSTLDLEGANQVYVVDPGISFYEVRIIAKNHYLFQFNVDVGDIGLRLLSIIGDCDIVDGTCVRKTIPCGEMPSTDFLADRGIFCVGSDAQHDWCSDVGSNILRLARLSQKLKPRN